MPDSSFTFLPEKIYVAYEVVVDERTAWTMSRDRRFKYVRCNNTGGITVTFDSSLVQGDEGIITQMGAGQVTTVGATGVTLNNRIGLKTAGQKAIIGWKCVAPQVIDIIGDTAA